MSAEIIYAAAGDSLPLDRQGQEVVVSPYELEVIDLQTGRALGEVIEASTLFECGWVRRYQTDATGNIRLNKARDEFLDEIVYGRFGIRPRA